MTKEVDPNKVETFAAQGLTMDQIADCLGIGRSTLYERMGSEADVSDAIKRGRAKGIATISNALFQSGKSGNVTAQIFYLKNRQPEEWKDRRETQLSNDPDNPIGVLPFEFIKPTDTEET